MTFKSKLLNWFFIALIFAGCAANERPTPPDESIIAFLEEGVTTKEEAILKLGFPSGQFDGERILTYRLSYSKEHQWHTREKVIPYDWRFVKYSLVLVFNDDNILKAHSLIPIE